MAASELALLALLVRGPGSLFPAFWFYLAFTFATQILFAFHQYHWHLVVQAAMLPLKVWVAKEAIWLRFWFTDRTTPKRVRSERYWLVFSALGVSALILIQLAKLDVQYNVPDGLGKFRALSDAGVAIVLGMAWLWAAKKSPLSPPRSKTHLLLLFLWFLTRTGNFIHITKGQGAKWNWVSGVGQGVLIAVACGWIWLFRSKKVVARLHPLNSG